MHQSSELRKPSGSAKSLRFEARGAKPVMLFAWSCELKLAPRRITSPQPFRALVFLVGLATMIFAWSWETAHPTKQEKLFV